MAKVSYTTDTLRGERRGSRANGGRPTCPRVPRKFRNRPTGAQTPSLQSRPRSLVYRNPKLRSPLVSYRSPLQALLIRSHCLGRPNLSLQLSQSPKSQFKSQLRSILPSSLPTKFFGRDGHSILSRLISSSDPLEGHSIAENGTRRDMIQLTTCAS